MRHGLVIAVILLFEVSIRPNLPGVLAYLNATMAILVFVGVAYRFSLAAIYGIIVGLALEALAGHLFGVVIVGLMLALLVAHFAFQHLFTNKSLYSLIALTALATVAFNAWIFFWSAGAIFMRTKDLVMFTAQLENSGIELLWRVLVNSLFVAVLYGFFHFRTRRFSAAFIDTTR